MTKARDIASAIPAPSTVSSAELGFLDGVTSAIQTQVDAKTAKATLTTKGDIYAASAASTPARLGVGGNGETLVADSSTATGLAYREDYAAGKNKIINGDMTIDQRNSASSAVTVNTGTSTYSVDRWSGFGQATDGVYTLGQDSSAPAGFTKSLKATVTTADTSISSTQNYTISQIIEGLQVKDFNFGTANAKTVTLSFWVRSSLTGTFGAAIRNGAADRSYPFAYSISVADTWEKKYETLVGDTSGTWLKDTGIGLRVSFSLGSGTDRVETADAWYGSNRSGVTGQVQIISTLNATLYVTGVQLEAGSVATAFNTATGTIQGELAACQRYYYRFGGSANFQEYGYGSAYLTTKAYVRVVPPVTMRTNPSSVDFSTLSLSDGANASVTVTNVILSGATLNMCVMEVTVASGLTQFRFYAINSANSLSGYLGFSAEL